MTLLVQTEAHVKQRQERRKKARKRLVQDALDEAAADVRAKIDQIGRPVGAPPTKVVMSLGGPTWMKVDEACEMVNKALEDLKERLQEKDAKGPSEDLAADGTLDMLRRLVPSEVFVAWASWIAAVRMAGTATLPAFVQWIVWAVYGLAAFIYVLWLKRWARDEEARRDGKLDEANNEGQQGQGIMHGEPNVEPGHGQHREPSGFDQQDDNHSGDRSEAGTGGQPLGEGVADTSVALPGTSRSVEQRPATTADSAHPNRGSGNPADRTAKQSPSDTRLVLQSIASMVAFLLLSAVTGDIYLEDGALRWTVLAVTPLFALFAQFAVREPDPPAPEGAQ